jgi:PAS domain S-box-containing protein
MNEGWRFDELHPDAYKTLVEGAPAILYIDRPDDVSTNLYTSPQIEPLLGFTVEEWMGDPDLWYRQLHVDDRDAVMQAHRESNVKGERFLAEYRLLSKDGRIVWIRDEAAPVRDGSGALLFWRGVMLDITDRKEAEDKLRWSLEALRETLQQRRELAQRLESAQEAERRRIAADIHDDPIQVMSAVDMRLQMLAGFPEAASAEEIQGLEMEVSGAIERLRSLLFELRPATLDREGLVAGVRVYLEHTAKAAGWSTELSDELAEEPNPDLRALLYRIAQEAIANAGKHADATTVKVEIMSVAEGISIRVIDDGKGFTPDPAAVPTPGHLGLSTMVERAELAGGWARVASSPGEGTIVECWLPAYAGADAGLAATT